MKAAARMLPGAVVPHSPQAATEQCPHGFSSVHVDVVGIYISGIKHLTPPERKVESCDLQHFLILSCLAAYILAQPKVKHRPHGAG